jgi:hypothetical protein
MNAPEGLDIRAPIGGLFTVLGGMLAGYGLFASRSRGPSDLSPGPNVNLWWGLVMLVFGIVLLLMARRAASRPVPAQHVSDTSGPHVPERATESAVLGGTPGARGRSKISTEL